MKNGKIKVLYIAGEGRSGSTLLEKMLGQLEGFISVGELSHSWERGFSENQLCGCGLSFRGCPFWINVIEEAFGGFDKISIEKIRSLQLSVDRIRHIPKMVFPWKTLYYSSRLKQYIGIITKYYRAIIKVPNGEIIVDSSKNPSTLYLLKKISDVDLHVLHLVRDSRGVAFSWMRKKTRPEITSKKAFMPRSSPLKSARRWAYRNFFVEVTRILGIPYTLVRYEDLIADPAGMISLILDDLRMQPKDLSFITGSSVKLNVVNHTSAGNPIRFQRGPIELSPDYEWREKMTLHTKRIITCLTFPLLWWYGYSRFKKK